MIEALARPHRGGEPVELGPRLLGGSIGAGLREGGALAFDGVG